MYDKDGKILYPFKIEPGIANQTVALNILKQEGFDISFLAKAYTILAKKRESAHPLPTIYENMGSIPSQELAVLSSDLI